MSFTPPPSTPPLPPAAPSRDDDDAGFDEKANAMVAWYASAMAWFTTFINWVIVNLSELSVNISTSEGYKLAAAASASAAAISAEAAASASGATKWITGTTYNLGDVVWSPISFFNYRRKTGTGVSNIDPSIDDTNWKLMGAPNSAPQQRINSNTNAVSGVHYLMQDPAAGLLSPYTLFLGATPVDGETRQVTCLASIRTLNIDPQGKKIRNQAGVFKVDDLTFTRLWVFNAALDSWI